jgi:hypothetical protein
MFICKNKPKTPIFGRLPRVPAGSSMLPTPKFCPIRRNLAPDLAVGSADGWRCSHRCSWITVYVLCCHAQVNLIVILMIFVCLLYSINCPTVIHLPSMLFILWRDTTSELWTPVHSFTLLLPFTIYSLYLHSRKLLSFTTRYA